MRVLMVCDSITGNGIASVVYRLYHSLNNRGISCDVVCYQDLSTCKDISDEFIKDNNNLFSIPSISKDILSYVHNVRMICRKGKYDVIHIHTSLMCFLAAFAAKKEGIKIRIGHAHGTKFLNYPEFVLRILEPIGRVLNRKYCTDFVTCSQASAKYTFGCKGVSLPNYVPTKDIMSVDAECLLKLKKAFVNPGRIIFGYMGSLDGVKNVVFIPEIAKCLKEMGIKAEFLLIGDGISKSEIEKKTIELNCKNEVKLLGKRDNCNELVQIFDYYISASKTEGMSLSMVEAQMAGKPCIVSGLIPNDSDLRAGLFYKIDGFDAKEWAIRIAELLDKGVKSIPREAAFQKINENGYTEDVVIDKLIKLYEKALL